MKTILLLFSISLFLLEKANSWDDIPRGSSKRTDWGNGTEAFPVGPYKYHPSYPRHRRSDKQNRRIPDKQALDFRDIIPARWFVKTDRSITAPNKHDPQYPYRPSPRLPHKRNIPYLNIDVIPEKSSPGSRPPCDEKPKKSPRSGSRDRSHSVIPDTGSVPRYLGSCECGISDVRGMIIQGSKVDPPFKYPWMVALQKRNGVTFCGGAIISDQYILTAAHCLALGTMRFNTPSEVQVAFVTNTYRVSEGEDVMDVIPYPQYEYLNKDHDIALLKLKRRIKCSEERRPICLPTHGMEARVLGQEFVIAGWGSREGGVSDASPYLMETSIKLVDFSKCSDQFSNLENNYHCLQGVKNSSPCNGDSGGPMFLTHQNRFYVYGVAAMLNSRECDPKDYFVFTKVINYLDWINNEMSH